MSLALACASTHLLAAEPEARGKPAGVAKKPNSAEPDSTRPEVSQAEASSSETADQLIERGIELRRQGDDAGALAVFQRAERLEPDSARVRVHLAATHQALGQWEQADRYLSLALSEPSDPYIRRHRDVLAATRRTIDSRMATLEVRGRPAGAQILLNGRRLGALPLEGPVRVEAGVYTLEARLKNHYPITRSIALAGGGLVREQIVLTPHAPRGAAPTPAAEGPERSLGWLPWTFAGLAAGAGAGAGVALAIRERHVERWNDDERCLPFDGTARGDACAGERDAGDRAETWMWIGTAAAGAFATASVISFFLVRGDDTERGADAALTCGAGFASLQCAGRF